MTDKTTVIARRIFGLSPAPHCIASAIARLLGLATGAVKAERTYSLFRTHAFRTFKRAPRTKRCASDCVRCPEFCFWEKTRNAMNPDVGRPLRPGPRRLEPVFNCSSHAHWSAPFLDGESNARVGRLLGPRHGGLSSRRSRRMVRAQHPNLGSHQPRLDAAVWTGRSLLLASPATAERRLFVP